MSQKIKTDSLNNLFEAILLLENIEQCNNFFSDLCTITELQALEQRFHVAKLLNKGKTYTEISEVTSASTATISRVNRFLNYGNDGYKLILEKISQNDIDVNKSER